MIGYNITEVLTKAEKQHRLISGLLPAINFLEKNPDDVLVCFITESTPEDTSSHIYMVLLQAFCHENDIPVVIVDNTKRLTQLCNASSKVTCAVVTHDPNIQWDSFVEQPLTPEEKSIQDFYEFSLVQRQRPVVVLPV